MMRILDPTIRVTGISGAAQLALGHRVSPV